MNKYNVLKMIVQMLLFMIISLGLVIWVVSKSNEKEEHLKIILANRMVSNGIKSLSFVIGGKRSPVGQGNLAWGKLKRLYINGKIANPDTLYNRSRFLYKHCGYYYFVDNLYTDSIVCDFTKIRYERFSHFLGGIGQTKCPGTFSLERYKKYLPACN